MANRKSKPPAVGPSQAGRPRVIESISNPLGFFVLALLIVEAFLSIVLTFAQFSDTRRFYGLCIGAGLFVFLVILVFILTFFRPHHLTFWTDGPALRSRRHPLRFRSEVGPGSRATPSDQDFARRGGDPVIYIYSINYDLRDVSRDYSPLYNALTSSPKWWHFLETTWLVGTEETSGQLWKRISPHIGDRDSILILEVTGPYLGQLPKDAWDWIKANVPTPALKSAAVAQSA